VYLGFPYSWTLSTLAFAMAEFPDGFRHDLVHALDNIRWMADYMQAAYVSDDEIVVGMGDPEADHAQWRRPEDDVHPRTPYVISTTRPGADVAAGMSAALAATSYVFTNVDPAYSTRLLKTAGRLYKFAAKHPGLYSDSVPAAAKFYKSSAYKDEMAWAATWLGIRTNKTDYFKRARRFLDEHVRAGVPWSLPSWDNGYHYALVLLSRRFPELVPNATAIADDWLLGRNGIVYSPKGLAWGFQWGSLRHTANGMLYVLASVNRLDAADPRRVRALCWARDQADYILGTGASGRSFVVGLGTSPPCRPHHRAASCPPPPAQCGWDAFNADACNPHVLTGALVGGPGADDSYADDRKDYVKNEVALDYNSGWTGALAALLAAPDVKCG
jgi:endoglucanase